MAKTLESEAVAKEGNAKEVVIMATGIRIDAVALLVMPAAET